MNILVTGGAGYIGSITNKLLHEAGHKTIIFDNLSSGYKEAVGDTHLIIGDLKSRTDIDTVFSQQKIDAVIHFAALALAGESMEKPYDYYVNNILGGLNLLEAMRTHGCTKIVFSSTCAVYGYPDHLPVAESETYKPVSVYGSSKLLFEQILDWYEKLYNIKHVNLRYFNAAGALLDGSLGEGHPVETHIIPIALQVALGKKPSFSVYGNDYDTPDGTCIRDYIHVVDLADAHIKALDYLEKNNVSESINLGVGKGHSNLEVLGVIEKVTGKKIPYDFMPRRPGDPNSIYADNTKAKNVLGWTPKYSRLETIIESAWKWHSTHPDGFSS